MRHHFRVVNKTTIMPEIDSQKFNSQGYASPETAMHVAIEKMKEDNFSFIEYYILIMVTSEVEQRMFLDISQVSDIIKLRTDLYNLERKDVAVYYEAFMNKYLREVTEMIKSGNYFYYVSK